MLKKLLRKIKPNPLDVMLKELMKRGGRNILIEWNRGLGDIALGLFAIVKRINQFIPDAKITFITRENLKDGFSMLEGVNVIVCPFWKRHEKYSAKYALKKMKLDPKKYDLIIEKPDPTYWVKWQIKNLTPKLKWDSKYESLYQKFPIDVTKTVIAIQPDVGSNYNLWRSIDSFKWQNLLSQLEKQKNLQVLLIGNKESDLFAKNVLDLRGRTSLFELLSILKNACDTCVLLDGGILSFIYYMDAIFDLHTISLWGDPRQGVLKQSVLSPNHLLIHEPIIGEFKNVNSISTDQILEKIKKSLLKKNFSQLFC